MDATLQMLKELAEAPGVSGQEGAVRQVMRRHLESLSNIPTLEGGGVASRRM
jgi:endoglucanase